MNFVVFKDKRGEWRWHLKANNNKIVAQGEGYKQKASAIKTIQKIINEIRRNGMFMDILVIKPSKKKKK